MEENECPVCYTEMDGHPKYACGHGVCSTCDARIEADYRGQRHCPMCRANIPAAPAPRVDVGNARFTQMAGIRQMVTRLDADYRQIEAQLQVALQTVADLSNRRDAVRETAALNAERWNALVGAEFAGIRQIAGVEFHIPLNTLANAVAVTQTALAQAVQAPRPQRQRQATAQGHKCGVRTCGNRGATGDVRFRLVDGRRLYRCAEHADHA